MSDNVLKTILVVDDSHLNRMLLKEILKTFKKYTIIEAENGKEAIDRLLANHVDLILMDIQMPVMGGIESMNYIRTELKSSIPIIAITAYGNYHNILTCGENSFDEIVSKPINIDHIDKIITNYLSI